MNKFASSIIATSFLAFSASSMAGVVTTSDSHVLSLTNWADTLTFDQFDTMGGTRILDSVLITMNSEVTGAASIESLDNSPATVTTNWGGEVLLDLSSITVGDLLGQAGVVLVDDLTAFDGTIDFAGTSGDSHPDLSALDTDSGSTSDAGDLAFFTGAGTVSFAATGEGTSNASGAGNLITQFAANAGVDVEIAYTYSDVSIPEPTSIALMGLGLVGLGGFARRRK